MKYEMIFGDAGLFDGAPESATHAVKGGGFYSVKNKFVSYVSSGIFNGSNVEALGGYLIAERRIIKEPKRWTWEDKKAGRLPEVLGKVTTYDGKSYSFVGESCHDNQWSLKDDATGKVYHTPIGDIFPIETPAEKAQREEDEFVSGIVFEYDKMPSSVLFEAGIRAAYRKLKGGE